MSDIYDEAAELRRKVRELGDKVETGKHLVRQLLKQSIYSGLFVTYHNTNDENDRPLSSRLATWIGL